LISTIESTTSYFSGSIRILHLVFTHTKPWLVKLFVSGDGDETRGTTRWAVEAGTSVVLGDLEGGTERVSGSGDRVDFREDGCVESRGVYDVYSGKCGGVVEFLSRLIEITGGIGEEDTELAATGTGVSGIVGSGIGLIDEDSASSPHPFSFGGEGGYSKPLSSRGKSRYSRSRKTIRIICRATVLKKGEELVLGVIGIGEVGVVFFIGGILGVAHLDRGEEIGSGVSLDSDGGTGGGEGDLGIVRNGIGSYS